jgi:hypothetical protein
VKESPSNIIGSIWIAKKVKFNRRKYHHFLAPLHLEELDRIGIVLNDLIQLTILSHIWSKSSSANEQCVEDVKNWMHSPCSPKKNLCNVGTPKTNTKPKTNIMYHCHAFGAYKCVSMIYSVDFGTCILDMNVARWTQDVKKAYL